MLWSHVCHKYDTQMKTYFQSSPPHKMSQRKRQFWKAKNYLFPSMNFLPLSVGNATCSLGRKQVAKNIKWVNLILSETCFCPCEELHMTARKMGRKEWCAVFLWILVYFRMLGERIEHTSDAQNFSYLYLPSSLLLFTALVGGGLGANSSYKYCPFPQEEPDT